MNPPVLPIKHVLISVFDKTGLEPLCQKLSASGTKLYSTGGTAKHIAEMGIEVISIESITQFPEMMEGRVKTLHPKVFGGILARRSEPEDLKSVEAHHIPLFDLVVVNLYPFWDHLKDAKESQSKYIDIGGPSLLRAAAKNSVSVTVLSSSQDYHAFLEEFENFQGTTSGFRHRMAALTFQRTSAYDAMIAETWAADLKTLPTVLSLGTATPLRYGENPHQLGAWASLNQDWKLLQGKELSYNNLLDADSAVRLNEEFNQTSVTIVKHNNPCGVASSNLPLKEVFELALACDPKSAFGGIVAINRELDSETAERISQIFFEVIIAPQFSQEARNILAKKKNLRLIEWSKPQFNNLEVRPSLGGWLIQSRDSVGVSKELTIVTENKTLSSKTEADLQFAWLVCKHVRSNAIVIVKDGLTVGIGAGQMSRVDAVKIALDKASGKTEGAVLASDAFFPFRDNIDLLKDSGISAVIQPGGSQRDSEVIQACNEHHILMAFTGCRHFRH